MVTLQVKRTECGAAQEGSGHWSDATSTRRDGRRTYSQVCSIGSQIRAFSPGRALAPRAREREHTIAPRQWYSKRPTPFSNARPRVCCKLQLANCMELLMRSVLTNTPASCGKANSNSDNCGTRRTGKVQLARRARLLSTLVDQRSSTSRGMVNLGGGELDALGG
jgi:hypothetical protein